MIGAAFAECLDEHAARDAATTTANFFEGLRLSMAARSVGNTERMEENRPMPASRFGRKCVCAHQPPPLPAPARTLRPKLQPQRGPAKSWRSRRTNWDCVVRSTFVKCMMSKFVTWWQLVSESFKLSVSVYNGQTFAACPFTQRRNSLRDLGMGLGLESEPYVSNKSARRRVHCDNFVNALIWQQHLAE